ncbi:MAG: flagellar protein FlgN [Defluviitaleaceae bacterium]|nr:flagellar protein FlgN [Defluviitaleaceae bacterium]
MASLIEDLLYTLGEQKTCLEELLILSKAKRDLIVNNDIENLQSMTAAESAIVAKNQKLDKTREDITADIATVLAEDAKELTITKIAELINDDKDKESLTKARDELDGILKDLKRQNDQNHELINVSLDFIEFSMNVIRENDMLEGAKNILDTEG